MMLLACIVAAAAATMPMWTSHMWTFHRLLFNVSAICSTMRLELVLTYMCGRCEGSRRGLSHLATGEGSHNGLSHSCLNAVYLLSVIYG